MILDIFLLTYLHIVVSKIQNYVRLYLHTIIILVSIVLKLLNGYSKRKARMTLSLGDCHVYPQKQRLLCRYFRVFYSMYIPPHQRISESLQRRVAIITGSSRGIGKAIALCFAAAGCKVVVNYHHSKDKAVAVAQEIEQRIHGESLVVQADVSKPDEVERMVTEAVDRFGRIDILVNNAGLAHPCNFLDVTLEEWNRVIDVNLTGASFSAYS